MGNIQVMTEWWWDTDNFFYWPWLTENNTWYRRTSCPINQGSDANYHNIYAEHFISIIWKSQHMWYCFVWEGKADAFKCTSSFSKMWPFQLICVNLSTIHIWWMNCWWIIIIVIYMYFELKVNLRLCEIVWCVWELKGIDAWLWLKKQSNINNNASRCFTNWTSLTD